MINKKIKKTNCYGCGFEIVGKIYETNLVKFDRDKVKVCKNCFDEIEVGKEVLRKKKKRTFTEREIIKAIKQVGDWGNCSIEERKRFGKVNREYNAGYDAAVISFKEMLEIE